MALRLVYSAVQGELDQALRAIYQPIAAAATGAIKDAAAQIKTEGRAALGAAGLGQKWQNALRVEIYPKSGVSANAAALAHHNIPYAGVFETGADVSGKPLLWIPLSGSPARVAGRRLTPRTFAQTVGPLVAIKSKTGLPLLASPIAGGRPGSKVTVARLRKGQRGPAGGRALPVTLQPIFFGIPVIHQRQRFNLQAVFDRAQAGLGEGYLHNLNP